MGVKTLRTILSSVTHNGKQASAGEIQPCSLCFSFTALVTVSLLFLPAHDDSGLAGSGCVSLHCGRLQFLPQVLQQE